MTHDVAALSFGALRVRRGPMRCPSCGHTGTNSVECEKCGLVYRKYKHGKQATKDRPPLVRLLLPLLGVAVLIAGIGWYIRADAEHQIAETEAEEEAEASRSTGKLRELEEQAAELGCPRDVRPPPTIMEQAKEDPVPEGWLADIAGWNRVNSADHAGSTILVMVTVPWCNFGKAAERLMFTDPAVRARLAKVVKVRVNPESSPEAAAVADSFKVRAYPSVFVRKGAETSPKLQLFRDVNGTIAVAPSQEVVRLLSAAGL
jgi:hypothetical protein